jgi:hypothetical protein
VINVAHLPNRSATRQRHPPHLARRQTQDSEAFVLGHELDARAGAPGELAALPRLQLDVVDDGARRDAREWKRVTRPDVRFGARLDGLPDTKPGRRQDVRLRAIGVVEKRDPSRPVRVVLDRGHLGGNTVLPPLEVDDAVAALVTAPLMPNREAALIVAAARFFERCRELLLRLGLRYVLEGGDRPEAATRARGLVFP